MLHGACTADHSCTCNREHGASHWGGPMNLRPLPEGAEEIGRAARGFKMPPRIGMHPPSFDGTRSRRTRKRQTRILFNMQPNKDTLSHSTWMAAAATGAANKQVLRVTIPRRRAEPLDTLERDMLSTVLWCMDRRDVISITSSLYIDPTTLPSRRPLLMTTEQGSRGTSSALRTHL